MNMIGNEACLLTKEEIAAAISQAQKVKYNTIGNEILSNREVTERLFWKNVKILNPDFEINSDNNEILELLFQYFSLDPEFEKEGRSLSKGIMLAGPVGSGKTTILSAFRQNGVENFTVRPCSEIVRSYRSGDAEIIDFYSRSEAYPSYLQKSKSVCFDDLGTEDIIKEYGNNINVIAEIIQNRHKNVKNNHTHFTTNLGGSQLEEIYGTRIRSRLYEMVNYLAFSPDAFDQRKRK